MKSKITKYLEEVESFNADSIEELEAFRIKFLGKKGLIPALFANLKSVPPENR